MQTEERSICPSCGGDNPKAAAFCWRCYASIATPPPAPVNAMANATGTTAGVRLGVPRMPTPPSPVPMPAPIPASGGPSRIVRVAVGVVASLVALFGVRALFDHGPSLPDVVAGSPRITTQEMKDFEEQMADEGARYDLDVASGAYGTGTVPSFIVLLVQGRSIEDTDDIFDDFVGGMASGGATVETSATESGQHAGVEYRCVPVVAPQIEAAACMWRDDGTVGIVFRLGAGIDETKELLFTTYDEVV